MVGAGKGNSGNSGNGNGASGNGRPVGRSRGRQGRAAMVVADFADPTDARRLATRLVGEGIGAEVWPAERAAALLPATDPPVGPAVVVRRSDHAEALTLALLFAEVDLGSSAVAPPPRDFWHGPARRQVFGVALLILLAAAVLVLLLVAVA
jgi:hypothetical protein